MRRERRGLVLQIIGAIWTLLVDTGVLFLLMLMAVDQFISAFWPAIPILAVGLVAMGPLTYGIGSWLRGELERLVPGPRAR